MTTSAKSDNEIHNNKPKELLVIRPICEMLGRIGRMEQVLGDCLTRLEAEGVRVTLVEKVSELEDIPMPGKKVIFAICLSESGVNLEYYRLLEAFRLHPHCLDGSVGGIIVDGASDLYTKALARRMAFSANSSGCTFPGKPLVEATGSLHCFEPMILVKKRSTVWWFPVTAAAISYRSRFLGPSALTRTSSCRGDLPSWKPPTTPVPS